jgi:hypothetical protein
MMFLANFSWGTSKEHFSSLWCEDLFLPLCRHGWDDAVSPRMQGNWNGTGEDL